MPPDAQVKRACVTGVAVSRVSLPTCDCDDGYELSGLDCIAQDANAPEPPADLACPAPGAAPSVASDPLFQRLVASRWYYVMNNRTCDLDAYKLLYTFRADGVFSIKSQFKPSDGWETHAAGAGFQEGVGEVISAGISHAPDGTVQAWGEGRALGEAVNLGYTPIHAG